MSFSLPSPPQPAAPVAPAAPSAPPMFGATPTMPQGQKPSAQASQPTYLGAELATNPANTGQKTLLGA